ncbi:MAG TPA: CHAT domain-containing protein [Bacteroidales bacterium]|nr:CHAT domain-containing protein [Bacteroidales bacterium]HOS72340.1 CHAT domain-containing protein [Bacteroidales bacterium]HQH25024.1 CHAT domain-containing protein [Bacteroidales bacterium]HQJ82452.1 CHAT domain-containing protein [Bacteroidales bacterium]
MHAGDTDSLFLRFSSLYQAGNLLEAEKTLSVILEPGTQSDESELIAAYNNLGVVNQMLGRYDKALEFFSMAESLAIHRKDYIKNLPDIYSNKGIIHSIRQSFETAIIYFEKSIRVYNSLDLTDKTILNSLASVYLNAGIAFRNAGDYPKALDFFNNSLRIKSEHGFQGTGLVYMNMAKTWTKLKNSRKAEEFYKKSIEYLYSAYGGNYFRLAEVYFDYGIFLDSEGRFAEAREIHEKALSICLDNYGTKHTLVALAYKNMGDHCFRQSAFRESLEYYQKSLIAVVKNFNDNDIYSNPSIDSVLFDVRLLDNLKSKSKSLEYLADEMDDNRLKLKTLRKSLETAELALELSNRLKNNHFSEESRLYISENEKATCLHAIHVAHILYSMTGEKAVLEKMYSVARNEKASILRNQIIENELFFLAGIPDSLRDKRNRLSENIAALHKMIADESLKMMPDSKKISFWKDALFDMNINYEKTISDINTSFPQFRNLLEKTGPVTLSSVRHKLRSNETILDYILSEPDDGKERDLYIFIVTGKKLQFLKLKADSMFTEYARLLGNYSRSRTAADFGQLTGALNYMYNLLVAPAEKYFAGKKLIIIPDEEISWLPFDAFLPEKPCPVRGHYDGLKYLINDYTVSYYFSASMIGERTRRGRLSGKVFAFYPVYNESQAGDESYAGLPDAATEIESLLKVFRGEKYLGSNAGITNFLKVINKPVIFHLAMHLTSDSLNSRYSFLLFDTSSDSVSDGKLYNYEISSLDMKSPMVVISSCNSGTGTLRQGEGLMSIARSFRLAGASSVVTTAWEINDETSARIISRFYYYLSRGKFKDEALRLSKLDYLREMPPAFSGPYYWAAYEITGDNSPVVIPLKPFAPAALAILPAAAAVIFYLRRRRIFPARTE